MKIYISSLAVKKHSISEIIEILALKGVNNIELTGGTKYSSFDLKKVLELKSKYNLNFLCHNYFPPPKEDFIINLGSLDNKIFDKSIKHIKSAILLSVKLESDKFACHSGFFIDVKLNELGNEISTQKILNKEESIRLFKEAQLYLNSFAKEKGVKLYFENNVLSHSNYKNFNRVNPFMFTDNKNIDDVILKTSNILVDFAHLKVSCNTLNLNFIENLKDLANKTDYWHISDNDGFSDSNDLLKDNSEMIKQFKNLYKANKTITIEVKGGVENAIISLNSLNEI